jgi:hypothetical protein
MIPGVIVDFLGGASIAILSTRDQNLVPRIHAVSGWFVNEDRTQITCLIPPQFASGLRASFEDNGRLALTVEKIGPHETYQFKGDFFAERPITENDLAVYRDCRGRFIFDCEHALGFEEEYSGRHLWEPGLAVTFWVREVFIQTPGPAAGKRLVPAESLP